MKVFSLIALLPLAFVRYPFVPILTSLPSRPDSSLTIIGHHQAPDRHPAYVRRGMLGRDQLEREC